MEDKFHCTIIILKIKIKNDFIWLAGKALKSQLNTRNNLILSFDLRIEKEIRINVNFI